MYCFAVFSKQKKTPTFFSDANSVLILHYLITSNLNNRQEKKAGAAVFQRACPVIPGHLKKVELLIPYGYKVRRNCL